MPIHAVADAPWVDVEVRRADKSSFDDSVVTTNLLEDLAITAHTIQLALRSLSN
jgi:hypothetical protein